MSTIDELELPKHMRFPPQTIKWFEAWKRDPITDGWGEAQCQFLLDTALIHAAVWGMGKFELSNELMRREQQMGLKFPEYDPRKKKEKASVLQLVAENHRRTVND